MTRYQRAASFLLFTRTGHATALAAGAALWLVTWPVMVPVVVGAVAMDKLSARRNQ